MATHPGYPPPPPPMYGGHSKFHAFREVPVHMQCPYCHAEVATSVTYEAGTMTWVICLFLILFGFWLGCCLIPFCIDGCKDCVHTCPNCQQVIGKFNRM
uniref:Cell death-inducing p53-target protein 1 homolog n=1 Tax=Crassostrea virginica TaxID=6565 RepID=A0A8B8EP08_CRAVI|nr:cell death-inducing p53-target protein 1 homolog [Crassostrea virginica]